MLELIEAAKQEAIANPESDLSSYAEELKGLGFDLLSKQIFAKHYGYLKITEDKILNFLRKKHATKWGLWADGHEVYLKKQSPTEWERILSQQKASGIWPYGLTEMIQDAPNHVKISVGRHFEPTPQDIRDHSLTWSPYRQYNFSKFLNWHEFPIATYAKLPPDGIIERFKIHRARQIFDDYVIGEITETIRMTERMKDPLLMGRIKGSSDRYLLGQWDDDILVDDLI